MMSASARPMAVATAPRLPGRSGRTSRTRYMEASLPTACDGHISVRHPAGVGRDRGPALRCLGWSAVSAITPDDLRHLAHLARIELSDDEVEHLTPQLDQIIGLVAKVGEVATA